MRFIENTFELAGDYFFGLLLIIGMACQAQADSLRLGTHDETHRAWPEEVSWVFQAAAKLGFQVELVPLPAQRSLEMAARGDLDGELLRQPFAVEPYSSLLPVSVPLFRFEYWLLVSEEKDCPATAAEVRFLKPVGVLGMKFNDLIYRQSAVGFEQAIDVTAAMRMLAAGRVDYFTAPNKPLVFAKARSLGLVLKPCLRRPLLSLDAFVFLHEKHRALIPAFERALRSLADLPEVH